MAEILLWEGLISNVDVCRVLEHVRMTEGKDVRSRIVQSAVKRMEASQYGWGCRAHSASSSTQETRVPRFENARFQLFPPIRGWMLQLQLLSYYPSAPPGPVWSPNFVQEWGIQCCTQSFISKSQQIRSVFLSYSTVVLYNSVGGDVSRDIKINPPWITEKTIISISFRISKYFKDQFLHKWINQK